MNFSHPAPDQFVSRFFRQILSISAAIGVITCLICGPAQAAVDQNSYFQETFESETLYSDFLSPFRTNAKYALATGVITTGVVLAFRKDLDESVNDRLSRDKPLGSHSKWGDIVGQMIPNISYAASMYGLRYLTGGEKYARRANLMLRATLQSGLVATAFKYSVREGRPYNADERNSFPSGHTTTTFAFASAVAMEHEWYWGAAAYALATFVGVSRVNDHQHYLHDVLAGATIGISYGMGVYYNMNGQTSNVQGYNRHSTAILMTVLPTDDMNGAKFSLVGEY